VNVSRTFPILLCSPNERVSKAEVMRACEVDLAELKQRLTSHIDLELNALVTGLTSRFVR
jgi:hypothetical protein